MSTPAAIRLASGVAVLALTAGLAHAQTVAPVQPLTVAQPAGGASGNQVYGQAFFAQFNLTNAEDLLRRIPGIATVLDSTGNNGQGRGLGAGGDQILINGKRMASKSTDVASALRRIPGTSVERVELIRGTSGDLEIRSEGLVVNIVLKAGANAGGGGQGNFSLDQRFNNMGWRDFDGLFSYSDKVGNLTYTLGYEKNLFSPIPTAPGGGGGFGGEYTLKDRTEIYYYPNGQMQQFRPQQWERQHHKNIFTAQGAYAFQDGSQLSLNLLFQPHGTNQTDATPYNSYTSAGVQLPGVTDEYHSNRQMRTITEIGGEYEAKLKSGTLNVIAIHNYTPVKTTDYRNRTFGSALTEVSRNVTKQVTQEDVIRSTFVMPLAKGQSLTVGAEGAKNSLNQRQQGYFDFNKDGRLETVPVTIAVVEEQRGEMFLTHNWTINPKVTLESTLSYEASQISTNFPAIPVQSYGFLKPRLDFRYNITPVDRLRVKLERTVSQLRFDNFVPIYNVIDSRLDPGNPGIAPEKMWNFEAGIERRLAKDQGTMEARGFYRATTDEIERGPFGGLSSTGLPQSAPVNLPDAKQYGLELKTGLRMTPLGLPNAQINARYVIQTSNVLDPFSGRERSMPNVYDSEITLGFRHDLNKLRAAYGATLLATTGELVNSDIRNLTYTSRDPRLQIFAEKGLPHDLTLRAEIYNLTGSPETGRRLLYTVSQANGAINRTESYTETKDTRFVLRLRGKF